MINEEIQTKLTKIYILVCEKYDSELKFHCQRFSNNKLPVFTEQEVIIFCVHVEKRFKVKKMHSFYLDWFPEPHSYVAVSKRINNLFHVLQLLSEPLTEGSVPESSSRKSKLISFSAYQCKINPSFPNPL